MTFKEKILWKKDEFVKHHFPFFWSKHLYKETMGRVTDFSNLRDLNEKIQWLMFYTDITLWTTLADKYAVRQYVADRVGEDVLVPLLGRWESAADIDFTSLPAKFVIKPNNGSYDTVVCTDKSKADFEEIRRKMDYSMHHHFGYENAEPHYLEIAPCIIAEQLLETDAPEGLVDYKIWCFNGKPELFLLCANRDPITHHANLIAYDLNWNKHLEHMADDFKNDATCPKPENLDGMLRIAEKLSEGLPQARVDLYNIKGKIYFGEMTMSSNFGMMPYFSDEILKKMGDLCVLPQRPFKEKICTFCKRWFPTFK